MNNTDFTVSRVPENRRLPFMSVALVHMGMLTALDQFMLGAVLGNQMTVTDAFLAILAASMIFGITTIGLGVAGMREGLSCSLLARWCGFGRFGSLLISTVIAVSLLGWFGVQNAVFATGLNHASHNRMGFELSAMISGTVLTCLVAFGFRALRLTAKLAVPLFVMVTGYISVLILSVENIGQLMTTSPDGVPMGISAGITMVTGGCIVAALITPDMSRYSSSTKHVFWMTLLSVVAGEFVINGLAILIARALHTAEVVTIMAQTAGGIGLLAVIFSTLRINDINLYSSSLGTANAVEAISGKKVSYVLITVCMGFTGTALSVMGILERFVDFLNFLGVLFPPVLGIMLTDYYILRTHRDVLDATRKAGKLPDVQDTPAVGWPAIIAWAVASIAGLTTDWGVPAINSLISGGLLYWMMIHALKKTVKPAFQVR